MPSPLSKLPFVALLLLAACTPRTHNAAPSQSLAPAAPVVAELPNIPSKGTISPTAPTVKIALLLPFSGDSATVGNAMLDAATMALSDSYLTASPDKIQSQIILL